MAKLRATESYVFTNDDVVGKGATCEVYKGINKVIVYFVCHIISTKYFSAPHFLSN